MDLQPQVWIKAPISHPPYLFLASVDAMCTFLGSISEQQLQTTKELYEAWNQSEIQPMPVMRKNFYPSATNSKSMILPKKLIRSYFFPNTSHLDYYSFVRLHSLNSWAFALPAIREEIGSEPALGNKLYLTPCSRAWSVLIEWHCSEGTVTNPVTPVCNPINPRAFLVFWNPGFCFWVLLFKTYYECPDHYWFGSCYCYCSELLFLGDFLWPWLLDGCRVQTRPKIFLLFWVHS